MVDFSAQDHVPPVVEDGVGGGVEDVDNLLVVTKNDDVGAGEGVLRPPDEHYCRPKFGTTGGLEGGGRHKTSTTPVGR